MRNEYEIRGEITAIFIDSPKYGRFETLISTSKLDRVKEFPNAWRVVLGKNNNSFYVQGHMPRKNRIRKNILLHRLISDAKNGEIVDHIDHNTLNNSDTNLRIVTNSENLQNRKGAPANSKSGVRGVFWSRTRNKWRVQIMINQKGKHIGSFDSLEEAENAAIEARRHHMPFSNEIIE